MIGETISHYRILSEIGKGGMGEVYLAEDTTLGRRVALKFLLPGQDTSSEARGRFLQEARAIAQLSHHNIVTLFEIGENDGRPWLAMEFVEGRPLGEFAAGEQSVPDALMLVAQIAAGLKAAHDKGIVHRDLKPDNILVSADRQAKITDFGLARLKGTSRLTRSGTMVGTISYMAPEQVEGKDVDRRADIFALGVILYELICGRRPFEGENEAVVLYELLSAPPQPMARYSRDVPEPLERLVMRALAKNPAERHQSVAEFIEELDQVLESQVAPRVITRKAPRRKVPMLAMAGAAVVVVSALIAALLPRSGPSPPTTPGRASLVVLPFRNVGDAEQDYFADGLTDEITSRIGRIHALSVISYSSAMAYKNVQKTSQQIGEELGVEYLLEGTVRWQRLPGGEPMVRVTPRLIQAAGSTQIWDDTYVEELADVFAIQTDIAEKVAAALNVALFEEEREDLATVETENLEAYDFYLRANDYFNRGFLADDIRNAIGLYERAVAADSTFAPAFARLARAHCKLYWWGYDQTETRLADARQAVDRALALDPELPEAHLALGYYHYWGRRDYDQALREFAVAEKRQPNSSDLFEAVGLVLRRKGEFDRCLENQRRALELDPRSAEKAFELGNTYYRLRNWVEAQRYLDRAIALAPDWAPPYGLKARSFVYADGDVTRARVTLESAAAKVDPLLLMENRVWLEIVAGQPEAALALLDIAGTDSAFYCLQHAEIMSLMDSLPQARACYDSARVVLERYVNEDPGMSSLHRYLSIAYAGIGRFEDALREGRSASNLLPMAKDPFYGGPCNLEASARIHAAAGRLDDAVGLLEQLMALPAGLITPAYLRLAPEYRSLWDHPRFRVLLDSNRTPAGA
ncbi:MAG TPA: protein kinase [Acidobacteriota bacterium]|nr:protein kinase [Acidobacteriota bacterium]